MVLDSSSPPHPGERPYAEDKWSNVQIGRHKFQALGSCRRCHMVCINQETAEKSEEPFITLCKTRRFDGKVFFGTHMCYEPSRETASGEDRGLSIMIGDVARVESRISH